MRRPYIVGLLTGFILGVILMGSVVFLAVRS
jgi:hypothetical protein